MEPHATVQKPLPAARVTGQDLWKLTLAGGAAFWIVDLVMALSPIARTYQAAFSISHLPLALLGALAGGLLIAGCTSYVLLRFMDSIPGKRIRVKAMLPSLVAMLLIEALSALMDPGHAFTYLVNDTAMNLPRFVALGIAIGFRYTLLIKDKQP